MHWRTDIPTPRGPKLNIRPKPDEIIEWIDGKMFTITKGPLVIEPFHFGLVVKKNKLTIKKSMAMRKTILVLGAGTGILVL